MFKKATSIFFNTFYIVICISCFLLAVGFCFGTRPFIVKSGSMEPKIETGSLVFVDINYKYEEIKVGDVIAFEPKEDTLVIHRVIDIKDNLIKTKGDNNDTSDGFSTNIDNFNGKVKFHIPKAGYLFSWLQTKRGLIISITVVIAFILLDSLLYSSSKNNKSHS